MGQRKQAELGERAGSGAGGERGGEEGQLGCLMTAHCWLSLYTTRAADAVQLGSPTSAQNSSGIRGARPIASKRRVALPLSSLFGPPSAPFGSRRAPVSRACQPFDPHPAGSSRPWSLRSWTLAVAKLPHRVYASPAREGLNDRDTALLRRDAFSTNDATRQTKHT